MEILRHPIETEDFLSTVLESLSQNPKTLYPKFFYDQRGSELFEEICQQPEYYVPNIETQILRSITEKLKELTGARIQMAEFGSGASVKTRILLQAYPELACYVPIDISEDFLEQTAKQIDADFPTLKVLGICADFTKKVPLPESMTKSNLSILFFFPGSSIGNFSPAFAEQILQNIHEQMRSQDFLLIGTDLIKERSILERAYNDQKGVTKAFNLNILHRLKNELGAELDVDAFEHFAFFNTELSRIEMHLIAKKDQKIKISDRLFSLKEGERIHTENSYKFTKESFLKLWPGQSLDFFTDSKSYFGVHLLSK